MDAKAYYGVVPVQSLRFARARSEVQGDDASGRYHKANMIMFKTLSVN
jgi:hypothetical protein